MQIATFKVQPIRDGASAAALTDALTAMAGVSSVGVSQPDGRTTVRYDEAMLSRGAIDAAVAAAGFEIPAKAACCGGCGG